MRSESCPPASCPMPIIKNFQEQLIFHGLSVKHARFEVEIWEILYYIGCLPTLEEA